MGIAFNQNEIQHILSNFVHYYWMFFDAVHNPVHNCSVLSINIWS